ncbi:hypothetical protein GCK32_25003, partial [Trichostrongylus colubriformis]
MKGAILEQEASVEHIRSLTLLRGGGPGIKSSTSTAGAITATPPAPKETFTTAKLNE